MIDENPYLPFAPEWHFAEAYLRKKRTAELQKEIAKVFIASRKRNIHLIFITPKIWDRRLIRK